MVKEIPEQDVIVKMNASLFEWVIENLSKNAVDAMGANGGQISSTWKKQMMKLL